jgi:ATP-binding cassette subfamily B (MDR/TAP) protein 1
MYLLVAIGSGGFLFLKISNFRNIGSQLCCSMRKIIINKYLKLHMGYFDKDENAPGALLSKLSIDTTQLVPLVLTIFGDAIQTIAVFIVGLILSFMHDWRLTLMSLCFLPFTVACHIMQNLAKQAGRDSYRKINIEAGGVLSECVVNTKTIYSFNFQKEAVKLYLSILDKAKKDFLRDSFVKGILMGLGFMAMFCCKATLYNYAGEYIIDGSMSFEDMNICVSQAVSLSKGTGDGLRGVADFRKAHLAFSSLFTTIDTKAEIDVTVEGNKDKQTAKNIQGKIEFKNVTFAYPSKPDHDVLKNISFTIMPGQAAALVGYSGCGKSTIIQLLERFYDVEEGKGEILIDGVNIKDYNLLELRRRIGLVSQEPVLFKRSVYENIRYGRLDATREEVLKHGLHLTEKQEEALWRTEHERWCAFHFAHRYRTMSEEEWNERAALYLREKAEKGTSDIRIGKNRIGRTHACLIPWEKLPELDEREMAVTGVDPDYQERDRHTIQLIPKLIM